MQSLEAILLKCPFIMTRKKEPVVSTSSVIATNVPSTGLSYSCLQLLLIYVKLEMNTFIEIESLKKALKTIFLQKYTSTRHSLKNQYFM